MHEASKVVKRLAAAARVGDDARMKRTTISLPDDLAAALEREAARRRVSVSQVAREAIETRLGLEDGEGPRELPFAGLFADGGLDAEHLDDYLAEHWPDAILGDR